LFVDIEDNSNMVKVAVSGVFHTFMSHQWITFWSFFEDVAFQKLILVIMHAFSGCSALVILFFSCSCFVYISTRLSGEILYFWTLNISLLSMFLLMF